MNRVHDPLDQLPPPAPPIDYAAPLPRPPWQLQFLVLASLVCTGTLFVGITMHAWRHATAPPGKMPTAATAATTRPAVMQAR